MRIVLRLCERNTGVLRFAQDDGEKQTTAKAIATTEADPPPAAKDDKFMRLDGGGDVGFGFQPVG